MIAALDFVESGAAAAAFGAEAVCVHCGLPAPTGKRFCCAGCAAAFDTIQGLGLGNYYRQRVLDAARGAPRPDPRPPRDLSRHVQSRGNGTCELTLAIDGLTCGACVWLIESVLAREPRVLTGRVNMTTRRLRLVWRGEAADAEALTARIDSLGYRLMPFDPRTLAAAQDRTGKELIRALAVAGFAALNVMMMSVGVWAGQAAGWLDGMGPATRDLLHWVSALIALPAIAYAGIPFFRSASVALRLWRTNMDVPISIGVVLVSAVSVAETFAGSPHTYFDSAITLLFFLLTGRVLDHRARGQARAAAEQLLVLRENDVAVIAPDGKVTRRAQDAVTPGMRVLVGMGERAGADGVIEHGETTMDSSLVTGESLPMQAGPGRQVFAGYLNLGAPVTLRVTAAGGGTLLAECVRLIEAAEARRSRFVVLADRVARRYAPAVHLTAALTFAWWFLIAGASLGQSLLTASAVLIVTCPCALALAVPAVQVIATSRLFGTGILLRSGTALERLAEIDTVVFDKTGTLTEPMPALVREGVPQDALQQAAALAACSRHPLARALCAAAGRVAPAEGVTEHPGLGLSAGDVRLGSRAFCGDALASSAAMPELWLSRPGQEPVCFRFCEVLREDAVEVVARLRKLGLELHVVSGDREAPVERVAVALGIRSWRAEQSPVRKVAQIERLRAMGKHVLMVGDGLNDSVCLATAQASASPSTAADLSQTVADLVFQGVRLAPVVTAIGVARRVRRVMWQNLALSIGYNVLMVPLAVAGFVTPWLAAAAMSGSSVLVVMNSLRLRGAAR